MRTASAGSALSAQAPFATGEFGNASSTRPNVRPPIVSVTMPGVVYGQDEMAGWYQPKGTRNWIYITLAYKNKLYHAL